MEFEYAVKTDRDTTQINILEHFPIYIDCQKNCCEVDLSGKNPSDQYHTPHGQKQSKTKLNQTKNRNKTVLSIRKAKLNRLHKLAGKP